MVVCGMNAGEVAMGCRLVVRLSRNSDAAGADVALAGLGSIAALTLDRVSHLSRSIKNFSFLVFLFFLVSNFSIPFF